MSMIRMALPAHAGRDAKRVAVVNSKGGTGKSTIAMNLAAYYASRNVPTTVYDFDPQESAAAWVTERSADATLVSAVTAARKPDAGTTRTWQLRAPENTRRIILDTPAGLGGNSLLEVVRCVDSLIVPVAPSPIDSRATARFVQELLLVGKAREHRVRIAVVANRHRRDSSVCPALARFLLALHIPIVTVLSDSNLYLQAAERGVGLHELPFADTQVELRRWRPLLRWLEAGFVRKSVPCAADRECLATARPARHA